MEELVSNNKTDPQYKSKKKSLYRSRSVEGKDKDGADGAERPAKQGSELRKQSSKNKKSKPRT